MELAHDRVHMKALAASRRPQTEKIGIVRQFVLSLFSRDVNRYRHALTVGVVHFQRCLLAVLDAFLVHQACRRVAEREEAVILLTKGVTVAGKSAHEQL